jgi:adenylosuccinate synthase
MTRDDNKKNLAIVGAHWGDEGKGKIVDIVSDQFDVVARYQGGHNAGHTIRIADRQFVLHLIPSGVFHPGMLCVIGGGVVLDPRALIEEWESLTRAGVDLSGRLFVSTRCHLILPYHRTLEAAMEARLGERRIGTTSRGIGPAYEDKMSRRGLRVCDLMKVATLPERIREQVASKNALLDALDYPERIDPEPIVEAYLEYASRLEPLAADTTTLLNDWIREGRRILFEGAQATLLDVDHGTFPFVTSSNSTACGIPSGLGIAPRHVHSVMGIMKAYATRVGTGPFPTEVDGSAGEALRERGSEFGATTGRPRRCGWFDGPAARYSVMVNDMDSIVVTKIDVLDSFEEIPFCTGYDYKGSSLAGFPADAETLEEVSPVYTRLKGWNASTAGTREWSDLPERARDYLKFLSDYLECPIRMVSTGAERDDTIRIL